MTILEKKGRTCKNCLYKDVGAFAYPCIDCNVATHNKWRFENEEFVPDWMNDKNE